MTREIKNRETTLEEKAHRITVAVVVVLLLSLPVSKPKKPFVPLPAETACPSGWYEVTWRVRPGQDAPPFNCVPPFPRD